MRVSRHRRQILLFLIAILAPAGVLIGLGGRLIYQERELSVKRAGDRERAAIEQVRRELSARLDAIRLQEVNRLIRASPAQLQSTDNPAVVFEATLDGDQIVLPWETPSRNAPPEFAARRQEGETQELAKKDPAAAARAYRQLLTAARTPAQAAEARLLLGRTLLKAGTADEAVRLLKSLLHDASGVRDAEGVGYRFYAAERLLDAKQDVAEVTTFLNQTVNGESRLTLPELYMIHSLSGSDEPRISARIAEMERAVAVGHDIPRLRARLETGAAWVPYGDEAWLATISSAQPPLPGLLLIVSSEKTAPPGVKLHSASARGEALGGEFPGLRAELSGNQFLDPSRRALPAEILAAGLALVLGIAIFGGYLLLRDVNRDLGMTEVRSQFVASVSHELKTPLTAIRMFAETLAMGRSRDESTRAEYLETIVNESERLARLVDNVLDFSKIEQGKKIYRLRATRLEDVAGSAVRAMQFPLAQQGFQLQFSVQGDIPELQADPDAIQQAILNLLTNAMKYSGDSREIHLRLGARDGEAFIEVADRGLGLTKEEQKHVFEKFYRAPSHESRLIAGTGLGLTLVAHIAKAHHGHVEVASAPGEGSTFSMLIPIGVKV